MSTTQAEYFKVYLKKNGEYSEQNTEVSRIKEGNNVFWFDEKQDGRVRVDIEGNAPVSFHINYIIIDRDVHVVSEFVVLYFLVCLGVALLGIVLVFRKRIIDFLILHKMETVITGLLFLWFLVWSFILPYNSGPDEFMRYDVARYIYKYRSLPRGDNPILCTSNAWGVSYAYSPYLSYLLSACMMYVASIFCKTGVTILHIARLISVISSTITVVFLFKISKEIGLKNYYVLPILVGLLPQFTFISAYVNNDAFAIMSVSIIIYAWCIGMKSRWNLRSCILLTVGMSICVAAYYNCYGYLLISFIGYVSSNVYWTVKERDMVCFKRMIAKGLKMFFVTFALSGWWFVRNYIIYDGDVMGTNVSRKAAIKYAIAELNPINKLSLKEQGVSLYEMLINMGWITASAKSFVGCFGYMQYWLSNNVYYAVGIFILVGVVMKIIRDRKLDNDIISVGLNVMLFLSAIIVVALSIIYSYTSDYQAQGRYVLPMLIPLMIFVCEGYQYLCELIHKKLASILVLGAILINVYSLIGVIVPAYFW